MRSEQELRDRLSKLERIARDNQPDCPYDQVPIADIENEVLRGEIYSLLWALDLIG